MWEDAAPMQEREPPRPPARPRSEEDLVLWAQILLCLAAVGFVLAAQLLGRGCAVPLPPPHSQNNRCCWGRNAAF